MSAGNLKRALAPNKRFQRTVSLRSAAAELSHSRGPIINMFAATFPKEVAGLVHIDPTDFTVGGISRRVPASFV